MNILYSFSTCIEPALIKVFKNLMKSNVHGNHQQNEFFVKNMDKFADLVVKRFENKKTLKSQPTVLKQCELQDDYSKQINNVAISNLIDGVLSNMSIYDHPAIIMKAKDVRESGQRSPKVNQNYFDEQRPNEIENPKHYSTQMDIYFPEIHKYHSSFNQQTSSTKLLLFIAEVVDLYMKMYEVLRSSCQ